jgi:hypothetical protein
MGESIRAWVSYGSAMSKHKLIVWGGLYCEDSRSWQRKRNVLSISIACPEDLEHSAPYISMKKTCNYGKHLYPEERKGLLTWLSASGFRMSIEPR